MMLQINTGQRWRLIYKYRTAYREYIVEILEVLITGNARCKVMQVVAIAGSGASCRTKDEEFESVSLPYGDGANSWELLENQDAPKDCA